MALINNTSSGTVDGTDLINTVLTEEANRIGQDIYSRTLHTSPWMDLIKQTAFADGMGYTQTTLIYDRAIPHTAADAEGVTWSDMGNALGANAFTNTLGQGLKDSAENLGGAQGTHASTDERANVAFAKQLKQYSIQRTIIESPKLSTEDLRFAAHRTEQLRAIMDRMTEATRYTWENRYRDEFERLSANLVPCLAASTPILTTVDADSDNTADDSFEGVQITALDPQKSGAGNSDVTPTANISNAIMDKVYFNLVRKGAGNNAYGRENGRPVFAAVMSSEASYQLQTEAGFRDDVRYNNARVSELIAPLGVEKSFRGFYHLIDDLAPRFGISGATVTRQMPYVVASGQLTTINASYDTASYEAAYVLHPEVMESQIPNPFTGGSGVTFDPVNYRGKFSWTNNKDNVSNPDGTLGYFRGILASASKPIKTDCGFVILFKRDSTTPAA
tara:strand:- start:818 stop:2158 length:1341 start_codon:yes stop_codon:yes gene_type:complete